MASTANPSLTLQLRDKDLKSKLKLICKRGLEAAAKVDPQLMAATAQIISQLTGGVPIASQISQVISYLIGTAAASFETSDKLNEFRLYAGELQKNVDQDPRDYGEFDTWLRQDVLPKLYAEAYSLNTSRQGCTCLSKMLCAQQINVKLDRLVDTIKTLNNVVNQVKGRKRQEKPATNLPSLPASVEEILAGKGNVLNFLNIGNPGIRVLCIVGMGGVGKTTMMNALLHRIFQNAKPVIAKVEIGKAPVMSLTKIQQKIVSRLEGENEDFDSVEQGQHRLEICFNTLKEQNRPVCLCIDNIWMETHLGIFNFKMYDNLPSSSYLVITTRTQRISESFKSLFSRKEEECMEYNLQKLSLEKAKSLFRKFAQKEEEYLDDALVNTIVPLCDGLPLALRVYGHIFKMHPSEKKKQNWEKMARRIKEARDSPYVDVDDAVFVNLEASISFQKEGVIEAFIDAVLFWRNKRYEEARHALVGIQGSETCFYLDCLHEDSIIERGDDGELNCHDLFVPLARKEAAKRNWIYINVEASHIYLNHQAQQCSLSIKDLHFKFSRKVRAISTIDVSTQNLKMLLQYVDLENPRFISFMTPVLCNSTFNEYFNGLQNLLALYTTIVEDEDKETKIEIGNLRLPQTLSMLSLQLSSPVLPPCIMQLTALHTLNLSRCITLTTLPDAISQLGALESLNLCNCTSLTTLPASIDKLDALHSLDLRGCYSLIELPETIGKLKALESFNLDGCHSLKKLPKLIGDLAALQSLNLGGCHALTALPDSINQLTALQYLDLGGCRALKALPATIGQLKALKSLNLDFCRALKMLPDSIVELIALESLSLDSCRALSKLPVFDQLKALKSLGLGGCHSLAWLPESIGKLNALQSLDLSGCLALERLPDSIGQLAALQSLDLSFCHVLAELPASIGNLGALQSLRLGGCRALKTLPDTIGKLDALQSLDLRNCIALIALPNSIGHLDALQSLDLRGCSGLLNSIGKLDVLHSLNLH